MRDEKIVNWLRKKRKNKVGCKPKTDNWKPVFLLCNCQTNLIGELTNWSINFYLYLNW